MEKERKIAKVVRQLTFEEAEAADDEYWSKTTVEERLDELQRLRKQYKKFIGVKEDAVIEKVVNKCLISEQDV